MRVRYNSTKKVEERLIEWNKNKQDKIRKMIEKKERQNIFNSLIMEKNSEKLLKHQNSKQMNKVKLYSFDENEFAKDSDNLIITGKKIDLKEFDNSSIPFTIRSLENEQLKEFGLIIRNAVKIPILLNSNLKISPFQNSNENIKNNIMKENIIAPLPIHLNKPNKDLSHAEYHKSIDELHKELMTM